MYSVHISRFSGMKYRQIHADTYRYALLDGVHICMYSVHISNYSGMKYRQIHTMKCISACICMHFTRDTFRYAQDTSLGKFGYIQIHADIGGYIRVCIGYAPCISNMHSVVSCAYLCEYLYVLFADTAQIKQCISVQYLPKNTYRYAHAGPLMLLV